MDVFSFNGDFSSFPNGSSEKNKMLCRCCLSQESQLFSLFNTSGESSRPSLNIMLMNFSEIKVLQNDNLPSHICAKCKIQLRTAYSFKKQVEHSDRILRENLPFFFNSAVNQCMPTDESVNLQNKNNSTNIQHIQESLTVDPASSNTKIVKNIEDLLIHKIFHCVKCDRKFRNESSLNRHLNICKHSTELGDISNNLINSVTSDQEDLINSVTSDQEELINSVTSDQEDLMDHSGHSKTMNIEYSNENLDSNKISSNQLNEKKSDDKTLEDFESLRLRSSIRLKTRRKYSKKIGCLKIKKRKECFICTICEVDMKDEKSFKQHMKLHENSQDTECVFCSQTFEEKSQLLIHIKSSHVGKKPHSCTICEATFKKWDALQVHIRSKHTKERTLECTVCPKTFIEQRDLNRHMAAHSKNLKCPICDKTFSYKFTLSAHIQNHINSEMSMCTQCGKRFQNEQKLRRHTRVAHTGECHECSQCGKVFSHKSRLRKHQLSHTTVEQRRLQCSHCQQRFNHRHHLLNHERIHTGSRPYLCSQCGKDFTQAYHLTAHLRTHTNSTLLVCEHCQKTFINKLTLSKHMETHTDVNTENTKTNKKCKKNNIKEMKILQTESTLKNVKEVKCNVCDESFPSSAALGVHSRVHTCKHTCSICRKNFSLPSTLESHMRTHTPGKRCHKCPECGCSFMKADHLRAHTRREHLRERPFSCTLCPRKFAQSGELSVHIRRHTGNMPFSCESCNKAFATSSALKIHIRSHTGEKPYTCTVCSRGFSTSSALRGHTNTHIKRKNKLSSQMISLDTGKSIEIGSNMDDNAVDMNMPHSQTVDVLQVMEQNQVNMNNFDINDLDTQNIYFEDMDGKVQFIIPNGNDPIKMQNENNTRTSNAIEINKEIANQNIDTISKVSNFDYASQNLGDNVKIIFLPYDKQSLENTQVIQ